MTRDAKSESVRSVAERLQRLPEALRASLAASQAADDACAPALRARRPVVATGAGGSSGPAAVLVAELAAHDLPARFVPPSAFTSPTFGDRDATLVIFSQRLSPNACLAVRAGPRFASTVVCTTLDADALHRRAGCDVGALTRQLPDLHEPPTLLRVLGPPCATVDALRLAARLVALAGHRPRVSDDAIARAIDALADARARVTGAATQLRAHGDGDVVFVTFGGYDAWVRGIPCTWQEGLLVPAPPIHDALAFAHGPLQQLYRRRAAVVALSHPSDSALMPRLQAVLDADRHALVDLRSRLEPPLSVLDHDAMVGWLLYAALEREPRDLFDWPGKHADGPLYQLGADDDGS